MKTRTITHLARRAQRLAEQLLGELESEFRHGDALDKFASAIASPDFGSKNEELILQNTFRQATSLPARVDALHKIARVLQAVTVLTAPDKGARK